MNTEILKKSIRQISNSMHCRITIENGQSIIIYKSLKAVKNFITRKFEVQPEKYNKIF